LYRFANAHGVDTISGGVFDEVSASGEVIKSSHRLWPQTEILKAHSSQLRFGEKEAACKLEQAIETLRQNHFEAMPDGAWREHIAKRGEPLRTDMPGSSLYHLAMAVAEIEAGNNTGITFENR
jgi:mannose-6-phosphate isomerase